MYFYYTLHYMERMEKIEKAKQRDALKNKTNINVKSTGITPINKKNELNEIFINYIKSSNIFKNFEKYFNKK